MKSVPGVTALTLFCLAGCSLLISIDPPLSESVQDASTSVDSSQPVVDAEVALDASVGRDADATVVQQGCVGLVLPQGLCDDFDNGTSPFRTVGRLQGLGVYDPAFDADFSRPNALRIAFPSSVPKTDAGGRCTERNDCQGASTDWVEVIPTPVTKARISFAFNVTSARTRAGETSVVGYKTGAVEVNVYLTVQTLRVIGTFRLQDSSITYRETLLPIPSLASWQQVALEHDSISKTITFTLNTVSSKIQIPAMTDSSAASLSLGLGASYLEPSQEPLEFHVDDLLVYPLP